MENELNIIFSQTYDGTIKQDNMSDNALSFSEAEAIYFSKMDVFMKSKDASEIMKMKPHQSVIEEERSGEE